MSSLYGERDYAFGQLMQTLRTTIGLTQAGLADRLGVSRRAVAGWETGASYPKADRLKQFIELGVPLGYAGRRQPGGNRTGRSGQCRGVVPRWHAHSPRH